MTKLESAEIIIKQKGRCCYPIYVHRNECCLAPETCGSWDFEENVRQSKQYIKEHKDETI